MAPKRDREDDPQVPHVKKTRAGFKVGPDNLPDGTWRRKVIKIKKDLIHNAKVKKSYAKIKARTSPPPTPAAPDASTIVIQAPSEPVAPTPVEPKQEREGEGDRELHPSRQAMLDAPDAPPAASVPRFSGPKTARAKKPGYFDKAKAEADVKRKEAEERRAEFERRDKERKGKVEERERHRRAMAKARTGGRNGQRKLGRESVVLLDKVRRMVG
ncbi:hypothetical protein VC83_01874 [Pseudogymnoascus destructans]|uniref:rRNA-processing protein FYV7 n=2 Tax=Pseudogymnoascus destructans TaxID=655981 RepID=L8G9B8_PSED2|nr:uncharacterized protein VC83_01874 [Pseudogymnoascus destructans]ELR09238.1 hypothetical protein GMDG_03811 [Pseudogymnoascus destructans 20631-21]OAF61446.1 hypothetical protein VC83_01874 [Pseudogymnoascus destructans]